jgi:glucan phosphoethanolaminetransferase (alkaline phosphatase superfamily)
MQLFFGSYFKYDVVFGEAFSLLSPGKILLYTQLLIPRQARTVPYRHPSLRKALFACLLLIYMVIFLFIHLYGVRIGLSLLHS